MPTTAGSSDEPPTTAAATAEALSLEAFLEGAAPSGTPATTDTTVNPADTSTAGSTTVGSTTGDVGSGQVPGQQALPLEGRDPLDPTGAGAQISIEADDTLTALTSAPEPGAESDATAAAEPASRRAAARRGAKKAPPRQAGEPAAREVTSAPARAKTSTVPGAGTDTTPLDARVVRQWAAANGITVPPRGPLSTKVREQYLAAH